ncbi:MAG: Aldehyde ferredoxin oxidoreductase [Thermotoga sp. 50_1627]|uniref:aldehyde ferredoxin oxidoreductase N-terminal domain-containing protein n=1 Tax=Pseudothermotoga sp. TaxID=2033661 RepID=UPI00076DB2A2|nr:MAG: Aldehyde ferredoxin oxidoreductase [Thermotoga sp. 50_64]KUK24537.1 MAG: Aldehyde ferredoxin oxidoreductase [Thermotoga sp. 50_1627]MBC7116333.1 aldehyde:ferredoxin oxidoreductase [Pseudothermotoga sp.]MDK2923593.1 aldehyde:ferredoxin oxidoreductase [Pseudothermotoga sp.]HBT40390.1 aldehyde:ferredoxin oxidoreductase [Pseudothermotoga sp.]
MYRMLSVDLTSGKVEEKEVSELFRTFIGGTGVLTYLAMQEITKDLDPFSEKSPIYFAIGPLNGYFPSMSKTVAMFRSPLTGDLGESHAGGRLSLAMLSANVHVLRITGRAEKPVYLSIDDDSVKLVPCSSLWGRSALATERILREKEDHRKGKKSIVRIGPAGERLSPIAAVTVDSSRHFGRLGLGAIMGSKNLKAIVVSGSNCPELKDKRSYQSLYDRIFQELIGSENTYKYRDLGTAANVVPLSKIMGLPTRNFSQGFFEGAQGISGEYFADHVLAQQISCAHCPIGCIHMGVLRELFADPHMYKALKTSYDHELIYSLGSNVSVSKAENVLKLIHFVERQGWDAISIGVVLAWATEAFQRGFITLKETEGPALNFGDVETYLKVLENIALGKNEFYRDLEKGTYHCAKKYGGEDFAICFNKNEAPGYMTGPDAFVGYAVGVRHSHLDCAGYSVDQKYLGRSEDIEKEVRAMYEEAVWRVLTNSLVMCLFARGVYTPQKVVECLNAVGFDIDESKMNQIAHTVHGMKYSLKESLGFAFADLTLPKKLTSVYTSRGKMSEADFKKRIEPYQRLVEEDKSLASRAL